MSGYLPRRSNSVVLCLVLVALVLVGLASFDGERPTGDVLVSLTSSVSRLERELPLTIESLLAQTVLPKEIRVYFADGEEAEVRAALTNRRWRWAEPDSRVTIMFVDDQGPGTKFLPLLSELLSLASLGSHPSEDPVSAPDLHHYGPLHQPLIIADDDHVYHPRLVETLLDASASGVYPADAVLGFRGWRINRDLSWGVVGAREYARHVVEGWRVAKAWGVGVLTANEGYLINPSLFVPPHLIPSNPAERPSVPYHLTAPILDHDGAPPAAKMVDDIWINYHLSALHHPRYVVPFPHRPSLDITLPHSHTLEAHLESASMTRGEANNIMLEYGRQAWEGEVEGWPEERAAGADQLDWYVPEGETSTTGNGETQPNWTGWPVVGWRMVRRWWATWSVRLRWRRWWG